MITNAEPALPALVLSDVITGENGMTEMLVLAEPPALVTVTFALPSAAATGTVKFNVVAVFKVMLAGKP